MVYSVDIRRMVGKITKIKECKHEFIKIGKDEMGYFKCKYCDLFTTSENLDNYTGDKYD